MPPFWQKGNSMKVKELYERLSARFPVALRAEWDHDGLGCSPDPDGEVTRALCTLDVTDAAIDRAIAIGANVIVSHHPLLFHPLFEVTPDDAQGRKICRLLAAGISVLSFHTRADAAAGGVNDLLAEALSLSDTVPFADGIGRIGTLPAPRSLREFAEEVKCRLGAPLVLCGDAGRPVLRVAVLGGSGKSEVGAAIAAGADTYLSGRLSYESVNEAAALHINLLEAGHFYTEAILPKGLVPLLQEWGIACEYFHSCTVSVI